MDLISRFSCMCVDVKIDLHVRIYGIIMTFSFLQKLTHTLRKNYYILTPPQHSWASFHSFGFSGNNNVLITFKKEREKNLIYSRLQ